MPVERESPAVEVARAHIEAWSNYDYDAAREGLADDVEVTVTTTSPGIPKAELAGVGPYMEGLRQFAQAVEPGSARVIASLGDDRNALLMITVETTDDAMGPPSTLPGARLYQLDARGRIQREQVIFFVAPH